MQRIKLIKEPCLDAKHKAFAYQLEAVKAIREKEYAAIFHEQGLGKTKIAVDLALYWLETQTVDTVLIITKKALIANWEKELATHSHLRATTLTQSHSANYFVFNSPSRLLLAHYEVLKTECQRFRLYLKARDVAVILDESARIKNPDSSLTKAAFELAPFFKKRVIMTGTPVANRPYDIWAQIYFLDHGESLGNDFASFKTKANLSNDIADDELKQNSFECFLKGLFAHIGSFTVRKTKDSAALDLPDKVIETITCDWEGNQYSLYLQIQSEMRAVVIRDGRPVEDNADVALKRILRLIQVASNPYLVDRSYHGCPGKLERLKDIVAQVCSNGEKCIVWTSFTENADWLSAELAAFGAVRVHGGVSIERRNKSLGAFSNDETVKVLIATPGAAKEGLTLTVANHVIFYDRTFSLDDYLQAQDRIHRISQAKKCYIYNLIMQDSIDEWIDVLLHSKQLAAQLSQGDISLEHYRRNMSYDFGTIIRDILGVE